MCEGRCQNQYRQWFQEDVRKGLVTGDLFVRIHAALSVREDVRCEVKVVLKALGRCIEDTEVSSGYYEQYRQFTFYLKGKEPFVLVELVLPYETPLTEDIVLLSLCRMALERIYEFVKQVVRQEEEKWTVCSIALGLRFCGLHGCLFSGLFFLRGFLLHRRFFDGMCNLLMLARWLRGSLFRFFSWLLFCLLLSRLFNRNLLLGNLRLCHGFMHKHGVLRRFTLQVIRNVVRHFSNSNGTHGPSGIQRILHLLLVM